MFHPSLLAAQLIDPASLGTNSTGQFIGSQRAAASRLIQTAWDSVWEKTVNTAQTSVYTVLLAIASAIAVFCLLFWAITWVRALLNDEGMRPAPEFIWVILVMLLLRGPGDMNIAGLTTGMRSLINSFNAQATQLMNQTLEVDQKIAEVASYSGLSSRLQELRSRCNAEVGTEALQSCLDNTKAQAQQIIDEYRQQFPVGAFADQATTLFDTAWSNPAESVQQAINATSRLTLSPVLMVIEAVSLLVQAVFQYLIEMSMLITALLGPIAVGATLLPTHAGGKPIVLWLTAFWSVGLCKLCLNVVSGVATAAMYGAGEDPVLVSMTLGIAAPILALAMAAGGGMKVFDAMSAAAGSILSLAVRVI
ncbi:hypothetical protein BST81_16860 [Leptolyngbya sp. 'hensonii']|uniref:hypothetical protein n=1 Tax=Leptolyngbya sp. 'hensonii' TaxID=1922337 RepID=UPI00094FEC79|nr:hypothetical protein [Leptolyngbya sp. 'hensonii']OLP17460.1 hypothetical protein BST81_16860 [Leptolyngbya sp. 'hensonii']